MAVLNIIKYPAEVLKKKTKPVSDFGPGLQKLIDDMIETMYAAPGVGLAANQVGVSKQVTVIDVSSRDETSSLLVLVNPEIIHKEGENSSEEGCLSIPEYTTVVKRAEIVKVKGLDRNGAPIEIEAEGLLARALQHEIDHLNGFLLIDRIGRIKREFFKKRYAREHAISNG
ncbi:MAG: peptide deformylase [Nitrospirae bacterium]|nr:peptide deformylase [Nitrospirota bacterium]